MPSSFQDWLMLNCSKRSQVARLAQTSYCLLKGGGGIQLCSAQQSGDGQWGHRHERWGRLHVQMPFISSSAATRCCQTAVTLAAPCARNKPLVQPSLHSNAIEKSACTAMHLRTIITEKQRVVAHHEGHGAGGQRLGVAGEGRPEGRRPDAPGGVQHALLGEVHQARVVHRTVAALDVLRGRPASQRLVGA
jgi:hypothetical protein